MSELEILKGCLNMLKLENDSETIKIILNKVDDTLKPVYESINAMISCLPYGKENTDILESCMAAIDFRKRHCHTISEIEILINDIRNIVNWSMFLNRD